MSNGKTLADAIITQDILDKKGVATLRTSPSRGGTFGQNGLDAEALKQKFDELPEEIAKNVNLLIDILIEGKLEEAMAFVNSLADGDGKKRAVDILNALTVVEQKLCYDKKALATEEVVAAEIAKEEAARKQAISKEASDRATAISSEASARDDAIASLRTDMQGEIKAAIRALVGAAPETLDTLAEIAEALGDNDSAIGALMETITAKVAEAKRYTDEKVDGKLDKITRQDTTLYGTKNNGQAVFTLSTKTTGWSVAQRNENGGLAVGDAVADNDAVPLAQMNTALADKARGADLADLVSRVDELERNGGGGGGSVSVHITDSARAYRKSIPANVLPVAAITEIGGASVIYKNPYDPTALKKLVGMDINNGNEWQPASVTVTEDGRVTIYPDYWAGGMVDLPLTFREMFPDAIIGMEYTLSYRTDYGDDGMYNGDNVGGGDFQLGSGYLGEFVLTEYMLDQTFTVVAGYRSYVSGSDPETGEEYWQDEYIPTTFSEFVLRPAGREVDTLYDVKVTSVDVEGVNLIHLAPQTKVMGGVTVTVDERGVITLNGTCTSSYVSFSSTSAVKFPMGEWYVLRDFAEGVFPNDMGRRIEIGGYYSGQTRVSIANNGDLSRSLAKFTDGETEDLRFTIPLTKDHTYENCKLYPMLVRGVTAPKEFIPPYVRSYPIPSEVQALPAYGFAVDNELYNCIVFRDGSAVYEQRVTTDHKPLSPFVETDITDILGWDGFIDVEGGGSITFQNQYSDTAPSTVVYQTK